MKSKSDTLLKCNLIHKKVYILKMCHNFGGWNQIQVKSYQQNSNVTK
jgi:hypothetical protein